MKTDNVISIIEEPNEFDDHLLDIIGNNFNFSHEKGLAEWLKNSIDAYIRQDVPDENKYVVMRFTDGDGGSVNIPVFEMIDYVGMTSTDINKALKRWGDPEAAKRGAKKGIRLRVHGGHGNGGKFYMRQMFNISHFITYRDGYLNIFGFSDHKKYGFAQGFKDKKISPDQALKMAGLDGFVLENIKRKIMLGKTGFTVVKGLRPKNIAKKISVFQLIQKIKHHPQSRRALKYSQVSVIHNGKFVMNRVTMNEVQPLDEFKDPFIFDIPEYLEYEEGNENRRIEMSTHKFTSGKLILKTSSIPFGHSGHSAELNCIDFIGEAGVIASYRVHELGFLKYYPQAQFIYGECSCPILEDLEDDCVQNDREKLVESDKVKALLKWVALKVDEVAEKIGNKEKEKQKIEELHTSEIFNEFLNKWKNQFMSKFLREILGGPEKGSSTGGLGDEGSGGGKNGKSETKDGLGSGGGKGGGKGDQKKQGMGFPRVLISGQDDPLNPGTTVNFTERHHVIEQRLQDVSEQIFWINREKLLARKILEKYGKDSVEWRNYLFQCYVNIFITSALEAKAKSEGGVLSVDDAKRVIDETYSKIYDKASTDLEKFLLNESYEVKEGA